jgi:hypothetical protein
MKDTPRRRLAEIPTWKQFARKVRARESKLLTQVSLIDSVVFVSGCQRCGTTILTNVLVQSPEVANYQTDLDSELEGALILSGHLPLISNNKRYCFQTTYLNERYEEYFEHQGRFKLVFVIRNPYSVVYSMMYHWKRRRKLRNFALNELFCSCGKNGLSEKDLKRFNFLGSYGFSTLKKACLSYVQKTGQIFEIERKLGNDVMVVEYNDIIRKKNVMLPNLFSFFELEYDPVYGSTIDSRSLTKAKRLSERQKRMIYEVCWETYEKARSLTITAAQKL